MATSISFGDSNSGFQAGVIEQFHQHLPPARPETPPVPSIFIPFSRDKDFVAREPILHELRNRCAVPASRTALAGLGGVGKSQLAIEFAYQTQEQSPDTWIFWVHASNAARFEESYRDIANFVKIPGRQDAKADVLQLVHDWLCNEKTGKWMLVIDNVDDAQFLIERRRHSQDAKGAESRPLAAYLPRCQNGSVLITTRSQTAALQLVEPRDIVTVSQMTSIEACALFEKKLGEQENRDDITALAEALEFMPLAMVQAASYIFRRAPRYSVRSYLDRFQKNDREKSSLLDFEAGQLRRDSDAKNSIIITWQISFEHIQHISPSAADLLSLMSFFDRQGIPESLLRRRNEYIDYNNTEGHIRVINESDTNDDESSSDDDRFENDISILRDFSFISVSVDGGSFGMHRLVQLSMRKWLEAYGQQQKWRHESISSLKAQFPSGEYENWTKCQSLFPHVKLAAAQKPIGQESLVEWALLLYYAAWYAQEIGNWADAEELSIKSLEVMRTALGADHPDTLDSMTLLASTYLDRRRLDKAEELQVRVLEISKKNSGADHPDTLTSMDELAKTYWNQGRWEEARKLREQVLETRNDKLGADHPDTLNTMTGLALIYRDQGQLDKAEELQVQVIKIRRQNSEVDPRDILNTMANLAMIYWDQGRWDEAEKLQEQVLETQKDKLGADHPYTLATMANLAMTYWDQGRSDKAEKLEVQALKMSRDRLGADHPDTLISMANLAHILRMRGRDTEALQLLRECVHLEQRVLAEDHPHLKADLDTLAQWEAEQTTASDTDERPARPGPSSSKRHKVRRSKRGSSR